MQLPVIINNVGIKISVGVNVKKLYYKGRCERGFIWSPPSKHFLVLKTSSIRLQHNNFTSSKTSWRHLQDVLEDEKLLRWRRLQDVLKTCLENVLKACLEDVLKTSLEDVLKTYLEDVFKTSRRQTKFLLVIPVSNKSKCVSNKSLFRKLYLRNLRRIQNASLRTQ